MEREDGNLPPKPERPADTDCCGSGCKMCVFDVYDANVKKWEQQCQEIRDNPTPRSGHSVGALAEVYLSEIRYKPFRVKNIVKHTHDTKVITFQAVCAEDEGVDCEATNKLVPFSVDLGLKIGQHVIMKGRARDGGSVSRAYTPIRSRTGEFDMLVKLYPNGRMSHHLAGLRVGKAEHFRGPYGTFEYLPNGHCKVLMLCAGTGVAPMYSIASSITSDERDETFVRLLSCVRTVDDVLLRDDLAELARNWNFTVQFHISDGAGSVSGAAVRYGENVVFKRLDRETVKGELSDGGQILVLICGTDDFNNHMTEYALSLGVQPSNIYVF